MMTPYPLDILPNSPMSTPTRSPISARYAAWRGADGPERRVLIEQVDFQPIDPQVIDRRVCIRHAPMFALRPTKIEGEY